MKPAPLPESLRATFMKQVGRVRGVLDFPVQRRLRDLAARVDALDAKLTALLSRRATDR